MTVSFPFHGELFPAPAKKYEETVFFVPFFEGKKAQIHRHIEFVNGLGFDAFAFELEEGFSPWRPPVSTRGRFGFKHVYADQIEQLLNMIDGDKIVFSFSNPTGGAIEALARRRCADIKALIADSGPSGKLVRSIYNLYAREKKIPTLFGRLAATPFLSLLWSPHLHGDLGDELKEFPKHFPILSIRGWKDPLISPDQIDAVFAPHAQLDWRKLALPGAEHLNGLRDFPGDYEPPVTRFLKEVAIKLDPPPLKAENGS
ncbi:MAG: hypothetical protein KF802_11170 [Bdellovibrionaceae bacterium]|nr:hypothetical protein [Pseudobdellovibrionaceae bacterium]